MARILLIFGLFFVRHIITVDAEANFIQSGCGLPSNATGATLTRRRDNLSKFLWKLSSQAQLVRFYNATDGDVPDKVYGFFQCRYDLSLSDCQIYVENAIEALQICIAFEFSQDDYLSEEGAAYYEECTLEYSYNSIFSFNKTTAPQHGPATRVSDELSNVPSFNKVLAKAINEVIKAAAKRSNGIYFASSETNITSSEKLYCFAQCSPILDGSECKNCLQTAFSEINKFNSQRIEALVFYRFCQLQYDNKSFLFQADSAAPSPSSLRPVIDGHEVIPGPPTSNKGMPMKPAVIVAISTVASFGLLLLIAGLWLFLRKRPQKSTDDQMPETIDELRHGDMEDIDSLESLQFEFKGVQTATCNFSQENKLGQGGFGEVYKGNFANGEEIAVKRLSKNSQQGGSEFKKEVVLLADKWFFKPLPLNQTRTKLT